MMIFRQAITVCLLMLLPALLKAQNSSGDKAAITITQIFNAFPFDDKLQETSDALHDQFSQNPFGLSPAKNDQLMNLFAQAFSKDSLTLDAQATFRKRFDPQHVQAVSRWIHGEDTQKVLDSQKDFYSLQGRRKRIINQYELEQNPPSEDRMALYSSLAKNISAAEAETESRVIIFKAMLSAFNELSDQPLNEVQIEQYVQNYRSQIIPQIDQAITERLMLMYRNLSEETLKRYIDFYQTEAGKWFSLTLSQAMNEAYRTAADRFLISVRNL